MCFSFHAREVVEISQEIQTATPNRDAILLCLRATQARARGEGLHAPSADAARCRVRCRAGALAELGNARKPEINNIE